MKYSPLPVVGALGLVFILVMAAGPEIAMADSGKTDIQQGSLVVAAEPGTAQPPPSGDVQERGLPLGTVPSQTPRLSIAAPFKCSAETLKCTCYGKPDCDYMRDIFGSSCQDEKAGCKTNCTCKIVK